MNRKDEVLAARARGLVTRQIAAELGISQTRVCQLLNSTQVNTVQPAGPGSGPANSVQPVVQPLDETAIRAAALAEFTAKVRPRVDALTAERDELLSALAARPVAGSCPACRTPLIPACPRCAGLTEE